jgi:DNA-binding beta-propeller fold protein YncE
MKLGVLVLASTLCAGMFVADTGARSTGRIPEARAVRACAGAGAYWPTMTLALSGNTAWVACKEQAQLVRMSLRSGRRTATVRLDGPVIAVASGPGSVWALDTASTLYGIDALTARVTRRIRTGANAAYNIWIGGGAVWVADDQGSRVLRISPSSNEVIARVAVSDGPADMVFAGSKAWVVCHRDNTLFSIDLGTNTSTRVATVGGGDAAAERLTLLDGSLWVTGRGVPLVEVDPETGAVRSTVDIHGTGIDILAAAGALWVPVRTVAVDRTGLPTMTALRRITPAGGVTTVARASGRVDVHGFAASAGSVWIVDNTSGFLYSIPT